MADARPTKRRRTGSVSKKALAAASRRYGPISAMRPELKYFDTQFEGDIANNTDWGSAVVQCDRYLNADGSTVSAYTDSALIPSAIGSGYGQVIGSRYLLKYIKCRGSLFVPHSTVTTAATDPIHIRVMLCMDSSANGAQLAMSTVMTDWTGADALMHSYINISQSAAGGRFRILGDKYFALQPCTAVNNAAATTVSSAYEVKFFDFKHVFKTPLKVMVKSGGSTPAIGNLPEVNIFLAAQCYNTGNSAAALGAARIVGVARAAYTD